MKMRLSRLSSFLRWQSTSSAGERLRRMKEELREELTAMRVESRIGSEGIYRRYSKHRPR